MDAAEIARLTGLPENVVRDLMAQQEKLNQINCQADWYLSQLGDA